MPTHTYQQATTEVIVALNKSETESQFNNALTVLTFKVSFTDTFQCCVFLTEVLNYNSVYLFVIYVVFIVEKKLQSNTFEMNACLISNKVLLPNQ